jgi:hypothetical protein
MAHNGIRITYVGGVVKVHKISNMSWFSRTDSWISGEAIRFYKPDGSILHIRLTNVCEIEPVTIVDKPKADKPNETKPDKPADAAENPLEVDYDGPNDWAR